MKLIPLRNGSLAIIDDEDFERVSQYRWSTKVKNGRHYAFSPDLINGKGIYMARLIMGSPDGMLVDHISMDTLDNRKSNLRVATKAQNGMNRGKPRTNKSGFKGVHFEKFSNKWRACISANGVSKKFTRRNTPEEAFRDYVQACNEMHGEFARHN